MIEVSHILSTWVEELGEYNKDLIFIDGKKICRRIPGTMDAHTIWYAYNHKRAKEIIEQWKKDQETLNRDKNG